MVILPVAITSMPFLDLDAEAGQRGLPAHPVDHGVLVLDAEIAVARAREAGLADLAPHPHARERVLELALQRERQLGDGEFGDVAGVAEGGSRLSIVGASLAACMTRANCGQSPRHANPGGGRRRPRTCAVLGDFRVPPVHKTVLRARQCRHRRGGRLHRCRGRGHPRPSGPRPAPEDRFRGDRPRRAAGRRHGRRLRRRRHQGVRAVQGQAAQLEGSKGFTKELCRTPQHPDRRLRALHRSRQGRGLHQDSRARRSW